jgi:pimeloyl-ACP methyl ester carboxylesterase
MHPMKTKDVLRIASFVIFTVVLILGVRYLDQSRNDRPQQPTLPLPYPTEQVYFDNQDAEITLAGTLSLPAKTGKFPAVILISGSGPQDRNEEIFRHKPFFVLADHLTRNGIAVLRYDDRGVKQSSGNFHESTSYDFSTDVESAIAYLKSRPEIDTEKIGLVGHSEGGLIAPMVASRSKDVAFIVLLAGPGINLKSLLVLQAEKIGRNANISETDLQKAKAIHVRFLESLKPNIDIQDLKPELTVYAKDMYRYIPKEILPPHMNEENYIASIHAAFTSPWYKYILNYDPVQTLEQVHCPVLAINGELDLQVPPSENLKGIADALERGGNTAVTIREIPKLNHLFQECETGSLAEYEKINQTFSPTALNEITGWILEQVK